MPRRPRILLVEDNPDDAVLFLGTFGPASPFDVAHVSTLADAVSALKRNPPDIVLLDLGLPDSTGLPTLTNLLPAAPSVPITVMTGVDDEAIAIEAVRAGAQDYLVKGFVDNRAVVRALQHGIERHRLRNSLEEAREEASFRAAHDSLTGLPNRALFFDRLEHIVARGLRYRESFAVAFLDLDRFKAINDRFGHQGGDAVLVEFAARLHGHIRDSDTLARVGGDEFAILIERVDHRRNVDRLVFDLVAAATAHPVKIGEESFKVSMSYGVASYPVDGTDGQSLLKAADTEMYRRKQTPSESPSVSDRPPATLRSDV